MRISILYIAEAATKRIILILGVALMFELLLDAFSQWD
jgi:hypothetical protein